MPKKYLTLAVAAAMFAFLGAGCTKAPSAAVVNATKTTTVVWWGVYETEESVRPLINAYRAIHPNVQFEFRQLRYSEYESELLNALSEDRGPDIMSLHNTWIPKYEAKLAPEPDSITVPFTSIQGTIKKEQVTEMKTKPSLTIRQLQQNFVETVAKDVVLNAPSDAADGNNKDRIFALPLAGDSLALYYNKDLLNAAGLAEPPVYWDDFQKKFVPKLTKQDAQGNIIQSAVGLGTARNVSRYADVLSVLMMQNGTQMIDENGYAVFEQTPPELSGRPTPPADDAVVFYTDFANPAKEVYTWNDKMSGSLEAFTSGKAAFYFGYAYDLDTIRARAPKLNFGISKLPQIRDNPEVNYANYWVAGVSKKSVNQTWAWDFLQFATSAEQVEKYLDIAKRPTALRSLREKQLEDIDLSVFADQMLTAKSWYRGKNEAAYEQAFSDLIYAALNGANVRDAIGNAVNRVNETYK